MILTREEEDNTAVSIMVGANNLEEALNQMKNVGEIPYSSHAKKDETGKLLLSLSIFFYFPPLRLFLSCSQAT